MAREEGIRVPALSRAAIEQAAYDLRRKIGVERTRHVDMELLYEGLHTLPEPASFQVREDHEMGADAACTLLKQRLILVRNSVYDAACGGDNYSRFTLAHELGHLELHAHAAVAMAKSLGRPQEVYCNSEWQADVFASYFLAPAYHLQGDETAAQISKQFGMSLAASRVRAKFMK